MTAQLVELRADLLVSRLLVSQLNFQLENLLLQTVNDRTRVWPPITQCPPDFLALHITVSSHTDFFGDFILVFLFFVFLLLFSCDGVFPS